MHEDDLVLRPDLRAGLTMLAVVVVAAVCVVAAILIGDAPAVFAPIVGASFTVPIILAIGALLRARIVLTPPEILVRGPFYRQRRSRSHIAEVVRATIVVPRGGAGESLFMLDAHRNLVIRVSGGGYKREDLDQLVIALGVPCSGPDRPVDGKEFEKTYPGLASLAERHPYRLAFATAGVICAAIMTLVLVSIATSS